jgi:hypothetical protein
LAQGEVAINVTDKKVWVGNAATTPVQLLGTGSDGNFSTLTVTGNTYLATSTGNVGVGTASPTIKLQVNGASGATRGVVMQAASDNGAYLLLTDTGSHEWYVGTPNNTSALVFGSGRNLVSDGTEYIRIDSSGNVGIGTSSPSFKLDVSGVAGNGIRYTGNSVSSVFGESGSGAYIGTTTNHFAAFATNSTERMRINSSGIVLIGTTANPTSSNVKQVLAVPSGDVYLQVASGSTGGGLIGQTGSSMLFYTYTGAVGSENYSERMRITGGSGRLLLGTDSDVFSGVAARQTIRYLGGGSEYGLGFRPDADNTTPIWFSNAAQAGVGSISTSATNTAYNTSSDYRLKENIAPMTGALDKVALLKPCTYVWKSTGEQSEGFIAHELAEVIPDAVTGEKDGMRTQQYEIIPAIPATYDEEGNELTPAVEAVMGEREVPAYQGIDTSFLVATLTAAIQELKAIVDAQAARIETLENK